MRGALVTLAVVALAIPAFAVDYSNNFESETIGTLPAGWSVVTPWGSWAPGTITAEVAAAPGGGQAMKVVWDTDWANNTGAASGEVDCNIDLGGLDGNTAVMTASYDFYNVSDRVWQWFNDNGTGTANLQMGDDPGSDGAMNVNDAAALTDVPINAWVHVCQSINAGTGDWAVIVSYSGGSGGGTFFGTADPSATSLIGQYSWGGWMFQLQSDAAPAVPYDNGLYVDNFCISYTPEPASLLILGLGGLLLRRR